MTKSVENRPPDPSPEQPSLLQKILQKLRHHSKKLVLGTTTIATVGVGGYWGTQLLVKKKLPPLLESQLSKILNRPVDVGKVEKFSFSGLRLGTTTIPPTATDPDKVVVEEIEVGYNLLPVILRQTLPLEITLVQPEVYVEQEANGAWLNLNLPQSEGNNELPIDLDITVNVEEGKITAVPTNEQPIDVQVDGSGRYNTAAENLIEYDIEVAIAKAKATIQGETVIDTGKTDTKLLINNLALTDFASLLPNSPVNLSSGRLNADLDVNIPSFQEITSADIEGTLSLTGLQGQVEPPISQPVEAESQLRFRGKQAQVNQTQASIGDIVAQVKGAVNWQEGYDLNLAVLPFSLKSLQQTLPTELPVNLAGQMAAQLQLTGAIKEPVLTGEISNKSQITVEKTQFEQIEANFTADLDQVVLKNLQITPLAGGEIAGEGILQTNIKSFLEENKPIDAAQMPLAFTWSAQLPSEELLNPYYRLPDEIEVGRLIAEGKVEGTLNQPDISLQWQIPKAGTASAEVETISGQGKVLLADGTLLLQDTLINVDEGEIEIEGSSDLDKQTWQTAIAVDSIALTPFLQQLQTEAVNFEQPLTLADGDIALSGTYDLSKLEQLSGNANLTVDADGSDIAVNSRLNSGTISATATTEPVNLNQYLPNLPVPATLQSSRLDLTGELEQLLSLTDNPNLSSVRGTVDANLAVAEGTVQANGRLNNNQWQANLTANQIDPATLQTQFLPDNQPLNLEPINAQIDLAGSINPLVNNEVYFPLEVQQASVRTGEQNLNATGDLVLANLTTNPDIANAALDVQGNVNFDRLPIDQVLNQAASNNQLLAERVNISGQAAFDGQLQGKNLISAPTEPGNLAFTGDLRLTNFAFNDVVFDPVMTGDLEVIPAETIAINLRGQQDVITAAVEPCTASRCRLPYLPTEVELRQGEDTAEPVLALGERQGDYFSLDILNFPLALLNLAPGKPLGIEGPLQGDVTGEINANLYTFATEGNIAVEKPAVGYITADAFKADFAYNSDRNLAEVTSASLDLGQSQYNFQGDLDFASGAIEGKLAIPQAYIQDILKAFRWFTIEDVIRLFQSPEYAQASAVDPQDITTVGESIAAKLRLLQAIEKQIQAAARKAEGIPTLLDIEGGFEGEVLIAGTLDQPIIDFEIEGNRWQWQPHRAFANIVEPLGLVIEEAQFISINQFLLKGELVGSVVALETAKVQLNNTVLSLAGKLSAQQQNASFQVANLTLDTVGEFVNFPVDFAGEIDAEGTIQGTLSQPQIQGEITFSNGAYNGRALPTTIAGNFNYGGKRLEFQTTEPSSILVDASIPYPIEPGTSDRVYADLKLTEEAFSLLGAFTQEQLVWIGGEGEAQIQATGRLDLNRETPLYALAATGEVNLQDATVKSTALKESLTATGKITLNNQLLTVESLNGKFAEKDLSAQGTLPILSPVANIDNPLTVNLPPGEIEVQDLYEGGIKGEVIISGAAVSPVIGGQVSLEDGQAFIPQNDSASESESIPDVIRANNNNAGNTGNATESSFVTTLNDLHINLENFDIQQAPLYEISLAGDLTLNGTYPDLNNLRPQGTLYLRRANVDWFSSNLSLVRSRENRIVFAPEAGILNPYLDLQLFTEVSDISNLRLLEANSNEIPDPISQVGGSELITVRLNIDGEAQEILPSLGQDAADYCQINLDEQIVPEEARYTQAELNQLETCVNVAALEIESDRQLLNSPAVELTSTPPRSNGEIVNLLGNQFLSLAEQLQNSNEEQLLEFGVTQFVIAPIQRRLFSTAEDFVVGVGKEIGLDYLRVYPYFEGIYELNRDSSLKGTYDYIFNEVRLEYQLRF